MEDIFFYKDIKLLVLVPNIHVSAVPTFGIPIENPHRFTDELLSSVFVLNEILINELNNRYIIGKKHQLP